MKMSRVWAMPNKWTFTIKPIKELINSYVGNGENWIDPFSGMHSPAEFTNDLNPESPAKYHLEAMEFAKLFNQEFKGCIFDPPYSLVEVSRHYKDLGKKFYAKDNPTGSFSKVKDHIGKLIKPNGIVISFGWNSVGFGKNRGFKIIEIMLVSHGGNRNDTIVTVEKKIQSTL